MTSTRQFVTFSIGKELFGIDILWVREINQNLDVTLVDKAPNYIRGLMNLRGQIVTIFDLSCRLELNEAPNKNATNCIILKTSKEMQQCISDSTTGTGLQEKLGLLVEGIGDIITLDSSDIETPPSQTKGIDGRFIEGVAQLPDRLMVALRIPEVALFEHSNPHN